MLSIAYALYPFDYLSSFSGTLHLRIFLNCIVSESVC